jgi:aspartyl-tRNA(Asn)/glutamyl-tRNA(Gln) amidotransferase subunit C
MPDPLTREDVQRIAELASLELTEAELETFTRQLAGFLTYAQQVQEIDTAGVPPTSHVTGTVPLDRPDDPRPSIPRDELLEGAPDAAMDDGLFRVPRVIA